MVRLLMARFDIYRNPGKNSAAIPYLLEVQSNVISGLATRVVIPLRALAGFAALDLPADLFPPLTIVGVDCFLDTPQLGAIPAKELKTKVSAAIDYQAQIQAALDRFFGAY
jgi:toxin CcdB